MDGLSYVNDRALVVEHVLLGLVVQNHVQELALGVELRGRVRWGLL